MRGYPTVREALLYERLRGDKVRCGLCERRCVIQQGKRGFCGTRMNIDGRLYTLVYGDISSLSANPIEKKPFFHFWPGSYAITIGTMVLQLHLPLVPELDDKQGSPRPGKGRFYPA